MDLEPDKITRKPASWRIAYMCLLHTQNTNIIALHNASNLPKFYIRKALNIPRSYYKVIAARAYCVHTNKTILASDIGRRNSSYVYAPPAPSMRAGLPFALARAL